MREKKLKEFKISEHWISLFKTVSAKRGALINALGKVSEELDELWKELKEVYNLPKGRLQLNYEKKACIVLREDE